MFSRNEYLNSVIVVLLYGNFRLFIVLYSLTMKCVTYKIIVVTKFQILVRTGTAGGPEGPPLILSRGVFSNYV